MCSDRKLEIATQALSFPDLCLGSQATRQNVQRAFNRKHVGLFLIKTSALQSSMGAVERVLLFAKKKHPYKVGQERAARVSQLAITKQDFFLCYTIGMKQEVMALLRLWDLWFSECQMILGKAKTKH